MTDGLFRTRIPDRLFADAARAGIALHVLSAGSRRPGAGIVAADLGPEQWVGQPAALRLTLLGEGVLSVSTGSASEQQHIAHSEQLRTARPELRFSSRGLRNVVARFEMGQVVQERVKYTLVRGPARVLAFGDAAFADYLDPGLWSVERGDPRAPQTMDAFDVVLIDSLSPADFFPDFADDLVSAADGTGVLFINGGLRGDVNEPQRIADWEATSLGPMLPVSSDPRFVIDKPPPRDVAIIVDISGSMSGPGRIATARAAASLILDGLSPQDSITIIQFGTRARRFGPERATSAAIARARQVVRSMQAVNEGTDLNVALDEADRVRGNYCAYFLISDAEFFVPWRSPQCDAYAIGVSGTRYDVSRVPIDRQRIFQAGVIPSGISFQFFEPEQRVEFFRPGRFIARADPSNSIFAPAITVEGIALASPRVGAQVVALSPESPPDPLVAFQRFPDRPGLATGVFLSDVPSTWAEDPHGMSALDAILRELIGWTDQERYDIRLEVEQDSITATITLLETGIGPLPSTLSAVIIDGAARPAGLPLRPTEVPGQFAGRATLQRLDVASRGLLVIEEPDRPRQSIPISFPPAAQQRATMAKEALDYGVDQAALDEMLRATNGLALTTGSLPGLGHQYFARPAEPIHAWFIALALSMLGAAYWLGPFRND